MVFFSSIKTAACSLLLASGLIAASGSVTAQSDEAQNWPKRAISYVVPYAPGGATDIIGRIYSQALSNSLNQTIVVDNRPGAAGGIGTAHVARAKPDGYTLVGGTIGTHSINPSIYPSIGYDSIESFSPVILTGTLPNVLVVRANSPFQDVESLIKAAQTSKDGLTFGSAGVGSSQHFAGELFASMIDADMLHVPYTGSAPSLQALASGEIDLLFDNLPTSLPLIKSGHLRALAITSAQEDPSLPGVKPVAESGLPGYEVVSWQAVFAPAGTPEPIVQKLYKNMHAALQQPDVQEKLRSLGLTLSGAGPDELAAFQKAEVDKWAKVAKDANITIN